MHFKKGIPILTLTLFISLIICPAALAAFGPQDLFVYNVYYSIDDDHMVKANLFQAKQLGQLATPDMLNALISGYSDALFGSSRKILFADQLGFNYDWAANINSPNPKTWLEFRTAMLTNPLQTLAPTPRPDRKLNVDGSLSISAYPLQEATLDVNGVQRRYYYIPSSYTGDTAVPLVLSFHGGSSNAIGQRNLTGLDLLAESEGFIAVFPEGTPVPAGMGVSDLVKRPDLLPNPQGYWNVDGVFPFPGAPDNDIAFVSALIDHLTTTYNIDKDKIIATGMSNGSVFCHRLAIDLSDKITAIACSSGSLISSLLEKTPKKPITIIFAYGSLDPTVSPAGDSAKGIISVQETINKWLEWNNITTEPTIYEYPPNPYNPLGPMDKTSVTKYIYEGGTNNTKVIHYYIRNGGHTWPGGPQYLSIPQVGQTSQQINLSEEMLKDLGVAD